MPVMRPFPWEGAQSTGQRGWSDSRRPATVLLDDVEEIVLIELLDRSVDALKSLINRHGADRNGGCTDDRGAHLIEVDAAGGEIHHGVGAVLHRQLQLLHLLSRIRRIRRGADVGVHLALAGDADRHRLQIGVVDVGRDDHSPPGHLFHHQRFGQVLPLRHMAISSVTTP